MLCSIYIVIHYLNIKDKKIKSIKELEENIEDILERMDNHTQQLIEIEDALEIHDRLLQDEN